jgi:hypothetical protein
MNGELLPHSLYSPDLAPSNFHLFSPLKEVLGVKRFRTDNEVKLSVQQWLNEQPQFFFERRLMKLRDGDDVQRCRENMYTNYALLLKKV